MRAWLMMRRSRILAFAALCVAPLGYTLVHAQGLGAVALPTPPSLAEWLSQNAFAIGVMTFHIGVAWREFLDHRKRITRLELRLDTDVPETYARKDVLTEKIQTIEAEMRMWRESFSFLLRRDDQRGGRMQLPPSNG